MPARQCRAHRLAKRDTGASCCAHHSTNSDTTSDATTGCAYYSTNGETTSDATAGCAYFSTYVTTTGSGKTRT